MPIIPDDEAAFVIWLNDHAVGVATHGATVGLTAGEIAQAGIDAATASWIVNGQSLYKSKAQEVTAFKNAVLYGELNLPMPVTPTPPAIGAAPVGAMASIKTRALLRIQQIKGHTAYTVAIGEDMRIEAPAPGPQEMQPELAVTAETGFAVRITFAMHGHDQIEIYEKRGNAADWTLLAVDSNSPYVDGRAPLVAGQPEMRQYRARYRDDDAPVGTWSDVISVVAQA